jgi:O-antigen/teichoic acid export membrane protein
MSALEQPPVSPIPIDTAKQTFFRQGSWMMFASVAAGAFMFAVHFFSDAIGEAEYGKFGILLSILAVLSIPGLGLQMVFAQQTAAAITTEERSRLTGTVRRVLLWTFLIWLATALGIGIWQALILKSFDLSGAALLVTVSLVLITMWKPVFYGILQGTQNFLWMGWASILSGMGRLLSVAVIVLLLGGRATGIMTGALIGEGLALAVGIWRSREVWRGPGDPICWRAWLSKVIPLTVGFGAFQFMFTADPMFVRFFLDKSQTGGYTAAGILSRALVLFTGPLAAVMFPKIVRSLASSQETDMLKVTLWSTAVLAGLGAIYVAYILPFGLRIFFKGAFVSGIPLMPPFAASMAVLTVVNVLINNLMARGRFQVVPWLLLVVGAYALTLLKFHRSVEQVIYTLGAFSVLMAVTCLLFTWRAGLHGDP